MKNLRRSSGASGDKVGGGEGDEFVGEVAAAAAAAAAADVDVDVNDGVVVGDDDDDNERFDLDVFAEDMPACTPIKVMSSTRFSPPCSHTEGSHPGSDTLIICALIATGDIINGPVTTSNPMRRVGEICRKSAVIAFVIH